MYPDSCIARIALAGLIGMPLANSISAQTADTPVQTVLVSGQSEPDSGGQIAKNAHAGMLGDKNLLDAPFAWPATPASACWTSRH